jgi:hypothetical protein
MYSKLFEMFNKKPVISTKVEPEKPIVPKPLEIILDVKYNTQKDNKAFLPIPPSSQCGYTSIAMVLSVILENAKHDEFISDMILNFEKLFLNQKTKFLFGSSMQNHVKIYQHYIEKYKLNKAVVFRPQEGTLNDIINGLKCGSPVGFSWMPTKSGHYSVIIGYSEVKKSLLIHDPWAKFDFTKKDYGIESGASNWHTIDDITPYMNRSSANGKGYRLNYLKEKV